MGFLKWRQTILDFLDFESFFRPSRHIFRLILPPYCNWNENMILFFTIENRWWCSSFSWMTNSHVGFFPPIVFLPLRIVNLLDRNRVINVYDLIHQILWKLFVFLWYSLHGVLLHCRKALLQAMVNYIRFVHSIICFRSSSYRQVNWLVSDNHTLGLCMVNVVKITAFNVRGICAWLNVCSRMTIEIGSTF